MNHRAFWRLPPGVSSGTLDYLQSRRIAEDYDLYFADEPLMRLDEQLLRENLPEVDEPSNGPVVADFGCGTGRISRMLAPLGYRVLNVDLSRAMLESSKCAGLHASVSHLRANMAQLDCLASCSVDLAVCFFSSIGMIRGRVHRRQFLQTVHRCLKEDRLFIIHVHNRYHRCFALNEFRWLLKSAIGSAIGGGCEFGDRISTYRGLPRMFLHIFSRGEIVRELQTVGFSRTRVVPISGDSRRLLTGRTLALQIRAGGYFVLARR